MKTTLRKALLMTTLLLGAVSSPCFGLISIHEVTAEEAKEWKVEVRALPAGPEDVRVEIEFSSEGQFHDFRRVDFRMHGDDGKMLAVLQLKEERTKEGRVLVSFATSRENLGKIAVWVVSGGGARVGGAYEIRPKDFVDLSKLK
ncbi:hypothetical protein [Haloferula sp. BvORR071]|uniref:hypothetical protein n=1 Tax=Haloferula sp. BvORR071 TaxID=1396141 RepID=UPI000550F869|nr:hypothetical protein [Haloferula sp. BvORR071]